MNAIAKKVRLGGLGAAIVALVGLGALAIPSGPAEAQIYFGFGPGGFNIGVGAPAAPYYYSPYYAYSPYYTPYYRPYSYYGW